MSRLQWVLIAVILVVGGFLILWDLPQEERRQREDAAWTRLVPWDVGTVDAIRIARPEGALELIRNASGWQLRQPVEEGAEATTVETWLTSLTRIRRLRTLGEAAGPSALRAYGLGQDAATATSIALQRSDGTEFTLRVGAASPDVFGVYAVVDGSESIELVDEALGSLAKIDPNAFRRYVLFDVDVDAIDWIAVRRGGVGWEGRRGEDGLWHTPEGSILKAHALRNLTFALGEARIGAFAEDHLRERSWSAYGLASPWCDLSFKAPERDESYADEDASPRRLRLGNEVGDGRLYARRDDGSSLLILQGNLVPLVEVPLDSLLDRSPIAGDYSRLDSLHVQWRSGAIVRLRHDRHGGAGWSVDLPPHFDGDTSAVTTAAETVVSGLERLQSPRSLMLARGNEASDVAPQHRVSVELFWPQRRLRFDLRWQSGQDYHWLQRAADPNLHWIRRDLYLRLRALSLLAGAIRPDE